MSKLTELADTLEREAISSCESLAVTPPMDRLSAYATHLMATTADKFTIVAALRAMEEQND